MLEKYADVLVWQFSSVYKEKNFKVYVNGLQGIFFRTKGQFSFFWWTHLRSIHILLHPRLNIKKNVTERIPS